MTIARPEADEYAPYYGRYIDLVPQDADILAILTSQPEELRALVSGVSDEQANARPGPDEWSIKEVLGHMADTERVFAYRMLRFARNNTVALPGFDQDQFVKATDFNRRTVADLVEEFSLQRRSNVLLIQSFTGEEAARRGTASNTPMSARAVIYILGGHVMHHVESLKTNYRVGA